MIASRQSTHGTAATLLCLAALALLLIGCHAPAPPPAETGAPGGFLLDPEIAGITIAFHASEVQQAELARERGVGAQVREFADRMIAEHTTFNQRADELTQRLEITPREHSIAAQLVLNSHESHESLRQLTGAEFDLAYIAQSVASHRWALNSLDISLIPATRNRELRSLLRETRASVAEHLQAAEQIAAALAPE